MPDCHLIQTRTVPPGGYRLYLRDLEGRAIFIKVGKKTTDILQNFDRETLITQGIDFRTSNNLPGANREDVTLDISRNTCKELGCDKAVCSDGSPIIYATGPTRSGGGCGGCGRPGRH